MAPKSSYDELANEDAIEVTKQHDLILVWDADTSFLVDRATVISISPMFRAKLTNGMGETFQSIVELKGEFSSVVVEIILRVAHGEEYDEARLAGICSWSFFDHLLKACNYYQCFHLVPEGFKSLVKAVIPPRYSYDPKTDLIPSLLAAFYCGWVEEFNRLFKPVLAQISVSGKLADHWKFQDDGYLADYVEPHFPGVVEGKPYRSNHVCEEGTTNRRHSQKSSSAAARRS